MPKQYEAMRDKFAQENRQAGVPAKQAYDQAQTKAAKIYNSKHPAKPVTGRAEPRKR